MYNPEVRVPVACGVKVTLTVHDDPAGMLPLQLLVWAKSLGSPPWRVTLTARAAVPAFFTVTTFAALVVPTVWAANVRVVGFTETPVASPLSRIACCPFPGEKCPKMVNAAVRPPTVVGVNVTWIVQLAKGARVVAAQVSSLST